MQVCGCCVSFIFLNFDMPLKIDLSYPFIYLFLKFFLFMFRVGSNVGNQSSILLPWCDLICQSFKALNLTQSFLFKAKTNLWKSTKGKYQKVDGQDSLSLLQIRISIFCHKKSSKKKKIMALFCIVGEDIKFKSTRDQYVYSDPNIFSYKWYVVRWGF